MEFNTYGESENIFQFHVTALEHSTDIKVASTDLVE